MSKQEMDRSDPAVRASLALGRFECRQRGNRIVAALMLIVCAVSGPFVAAPLTGGPGATFGAIVAAVLFAGNAVVIWPWSWSKAEREHHTNAAIWAQARPGTRSETAWDRYAAWAGADGDRVRLVLLRRAGTGGDDALPSPFSATVGETFDADAILDATEGMERLRAEAAQREGDARDRHEQALAAAARKPYDDALRELDESAADEQRRSEARMRHELAEQEAAERRAQAAAVAPALRRP